MSTTLQNTNEVQIELKIQQGIRQAEDNLVERIQEALDKKKFDYGDLEESQFRNLVRVSDTTDSAEVIKNFLMYQVGRDKKWGRGQKSLADRIIKDINELKEKAKEIANRSGSKEINRIYLDLIRRYLGYGARYLTYLRKGQA
jgi:hypothetical protein